MIFYTLKNKTCRIKNAAHFISKLNQPIRFESGTSARYPDYEMIYNFPLVRLASIVNKLKLYHTVATGVSIPAAGILAAFDVIGTDIVLTLSSAGLTWGLALFAVGFLGQNRVGFIYLKNDGKIVKISYADFWGRRVDTDIDIHDIWPLSDLPTSALNPLYYSLRRYSTKDTLKFNVRYSNIVNPEKFQLVLGDSSLDAKK